MYRAFALKNVRAIAHPPQQLLRRMPLRMLNKFIRTSLLSLAALLVSSAVIAQRTSETVLKLSRAGFDYEQQQQYRLAIYEYDSAIKLDPKYPYPYSRIGAIYYTLKNYSLAIRYYSAAIKLDSNFDVYNFFNLGKPYRVLGKIEEVEHVKIG